VSGVVSGVVSGPVQVLVVGFDEPSFSGEVVSELTRLTEAGIVRLIDVLLVARGADGSLDTLPPPPGADPELGRLTAAFLEVREGSPEPGGPATGDAPGASWSLEDDVPPGGVAAVALLEHLWAAPLVGAIRRAGGRPLDETWLAAEEVALLERLVERAEDEPGQASG
jgi:hypothetical protein